MSTETPLNNVWVAVQTRILHEKRVAEQLCANEYECFLPLCYKEPCGSAPDFRVNKHRATVPLFPGYLFCRYKESPKFHIRQASGVIKIICCKGIPVIVPNNEIESIRKIVISGFFVKPCKYLKIGLKVRVCSSGCFNGVEGYLMGVNKNKCKIVSGISLLGRAITITVDADQVRQIVD